MMYDWLFEEKEESNKKVSQRQEKRIAEDLRGSVVVGSGATPFFKGDVNVLDYIIEAKTVKTPKKSLSIKGEWIEKVEQEVFETGKENWMLAISGFEGRETEDFYLMSKDLLNDFIECKRIVENIMEELNYDLEVNMFEIEEESEIKRFINKMIEKEM